MTETQWLTATEVAQYLKVKPRTILAWPSKGASLDTPIRCSTHHVAKSFPIQR